MDMLYYVVYWINWFAKFDHTQKKTFPGPIHNKAMDLWAKEIDPLVA